jgi:hypothetical protein
MTSALASDLHPMAVLRTRMAAASTTRGAKPALRETRGSTLRTQLTLFLRRIPMHPLMHPMHPPTARRPGARRKAAPRPLVRRIPSRTARPTTISDSSTLPLRISPLPRPTRAIPVRSARATTANQCTGVCPRAPTARGRRARRDPIAVRVSPASRKSRKRTHRRDSRGGVAIPIVAATRSALRNLDQTEGSIRRSARRVRSSRAKVRRRSSSRCAWPSITAVSTSHIRARVGRRARAPATWPAPSSTTPRRTRRVFVRARGDPATPAPRASPAHGAICALRRAPA